MLHLYSLTPLFAILPFCCVAMLPHSPLFLNHFVKSSPPINLSTRLPTKSHLIPSHPIPIPYPPFPTYFSNLHPPTPPRKQTSLTPSPPSPQTNRSSHTSPPPKHQLSASGCWRYRRNACGQAPTERISRISSPCGAGRIVVLRRMSRFLFPPSSPLSPFFRKRDGEAEGEMLRAEMVWDTM